MYDSTNKTSQHNNFVEAYTKAIF